MDVLKILAEFEFPVAPRKKTKRQETVPKTYSSQKKIRKKKTDAAGSGSRR